MTVLLVGACGSGKTWVMNQLITEYNLNLKAKTKLIHFRTNKKICVLGNYDRSVFEGGDKLSMAVSLDFDNFKKITDRENFIVICEGDRFTNKKFIKIFTPFIIKIQDEGEAGRKARGSNQSKRHISSIQTRVNNIKENKLVKNSDEALSLIKQIINEKSRPN
jgi:GTPase SAR1 family protein